MTVRRSCELECDGCGKKVEWWARGGRPEDWRRLRIIDGMGTQTVSDVCSPRCASRAVDKTYGRDDALAAGRLLHALPR